MLYLGKDIESGQRLLYDLDDLTTHAVCFGMTGSGKTGLCLVLIEEVIRAGVPVFLVDPKGDLANLLLAFPGLTAREFEPWIDPDQARAAGQTTPQFAETTATRWREGLAAGGLGPSDVQALRDAAEFVLHTPGSTAGRPLNVLGGFTPPETQDWDADPEPLRSRITGTVGALLDLVGIDADPVQCPEAAFLARLFELRWRAGQPLTLEAMIRELQEPGEGMKTLGAMDTETLLPRPRRMQVAMALNSLLAAPSFAAWTQGEPLDISRMLRASDGRRPRVNVLYIAHLSDRERVFFVAAFLQSLITWMRTQPGSSSLRALFYMDEIFGYFPPTANPPTKAPLLTLLKQARAFGLGTMLATQNPVDVDYKGLANTGTWFLGKLQTEQDRARLLDGLSGTAVDRGAVEAALAEGSLLRPALRARVRLQFQGSSAGAGADLEEDLVLALGQAARPGGLSWDRAVPLAELSPESPAARAPEGVTFGDLPDAFRAATAFRTAASGLETFLAGQRTLSELRNRQLKLSSARGEERDGFLERCRVEAERRADVEELALKSKYEEKIRRLQARVAKELRELEQDKQELAGRKVDELVNAGETLLGMFLGGRRRSISGIAGRRRMVSNTSSQVEKSQAEYDAAQAELQRLSEEASRALEDLDRRWNEVAEGIEAVPIKPLKSGVNVLEIGLIWTAK